jgi:diaminopimelate epimerase
MHGAGNDYVYVDLFAETVDDAPALARAVSDRHTGIGGDGLILLAPSETADVRMIMYNADGSRAQMCGNGVRCLAKLARDRGRTTGDSIAVETDDGIKTVEFTPQGLRVDMGVPRLDPASLPADLPGTHATLEVLGASFDVTAVSMGNPHVVTYVDDVSRIDVARFGAAIENDPRFPERTNVEFVEVVSDVSVRQRTWERGSGETLACGTGACAVCVAGIVTGRTGSPVLSHLLGGDLLLEWDGEGSVFMTGPAVEVFQGDYGM